LVFSRVGTSSRLSPFGSVSAEEVRDWSRLGRLLRKERKRRMTGIE
jgi:hypothetical protein